MAIFLKTKKPEATISLAERHFSVYDKGNSCRRQAVRAVPGNWYLKVIG